MYENKRFFTVRKLSEKQRRAALNAAEYYGVTEAEIKNTSTRKVTEVCRLICLTLRYFTDGATGGSISIGLNRNIEFCRDSCKAGKKLLKESPDFADKLRDFAMIYNNEYKRLIEQ